MTKLQEKDKKTIVEMYKTDRYTMAELGKMFGISRGRVSQLVNDNYSEGFKVE